MIVIWNRPGSHFDLQANCGAALTFKLTLDLQITGKTEAIDKQEGGHIVNLLRH